MRGVRKICTKSSDFFAEKLKERKEVMQTKPLQNLSNYTSHYFLGGKNLNMILIFFSRIEDPVAVSSDKASAIRSTKEEISTFSTHLLKDATFAGIS